MDSLDYEAIDPGIRETVRWLRRCLDGDTVDSGDGRSKVEAIAEGEALPYPHVMMRGTVDTADWLARAIKDMGVALVENGSEEPGAQVSFSYDPVNEVGIVALTHFDDSMLALERAAT